jgi:DNA helicase HerA-like ATPase
MPARSWYVREVTTIPLLGDAGAGPWFRVVSVPAGPHPESAEQDYAAVLPAVLHAAARRLPFVVGWLCRGAGHPLELITNAAPAEPVTHTPAAPVTGVPAGPRSLLFPPGARGVSASPDWLAFCAGLAWAPCAARPAAPADAAAAGTWGGQRAAPPTRFEAALTALLGRPFGWLVVAEPTGLLDSEVARLRTQATLERRHETERSRFSAERAGRRLAELDAYREGGLWSVRVLAGAASGAELATVAPVLAGSAATEFHPYRLIRTGGNEDFAAALSVTWQDAETAGGAPFLATAGILGALAGLPRAEVPGVRVVEQARFDLTRESTTSSPAAGGAGGGQPAVSLGMILDGLDRPVGAFEVPLATLNRHVFVTGATGSGKSQTVRHLLEQLTRAGVPWLVIEPAKSEYAAMAGRLADIGGTGAVTVIHPADPASIPLSVNPLAPEPGYPVQVHIDLVRALFLAAFAADEPFPQVMSQALERVYLEAGWDLVTGGRAPGAATAPTVPTLAQLQRAAAAVIEDVGYGRELQADVRGFVDVRLRSLRTGAAGRFFEGGHPGDVGALLRRNAVLAIEDVASDEDKAFLMGTLIIRIVEYLRLRARLGRAEGLRHVLVIEEAHRLLRQRDRGPGAHAVELFAGLLAEIRAYGEGLVVAEQIPAKLVPDVLKNTALKVVHRLPARDDRDLVGAAMNLAEDQGRQVVSFPPGVAAVFADGMDRPVRVAVPGGGHREHARHGPPPPLAGRRSPACGPCCTGGRACTQLELRRGELAACGADPGAAWLRIWAETLVLGFLTDQILPAVPAGLARWWREQEPRTGECALASVLEGVVAGRAPALRATADPAALCAAAAGAARGLLGGAAPAGRRPGQARVIPQLRWLHEMERLCPLAGPLPAPQRRAPALDFELPGLSDWAGMLVGQRIRALRRHPFSCELPHNQAVAWLALLGADDQRGFAADLATVGVGTRSREQLGRAAAAMGVSGWLEVVLSWPRRFLAAEIPWAGGPEPGEPSPAPSEAPAR